MLRHWFIAGLTTNQADVEKDDGCACSHMYHQTLSVNRLNDAELLFGVPSRKSLNKVY